MAEKQILFAFRGDPLCFVHVLLNALDLHEQELGGWIVIEGEAVKLVGQISRPEHFLNAFYRQVREKGLIVAVCKACSAKMEVTAEVEAEGLPLVGHIAGHPSMAHYLKEGYRVITF
ncbi:putative cytoplasmic protein [Desulfurivibrio alkaliphilus AHT 2]|uniref:Putative cytoplasmic protein n=2 Tax=Desulfurivibrio alkaliphilus TaxID=427923 RepID=D6Z5V1_DESAT|nr:putative cytoplasmic protein [Desulfurivibrio alkaliphilus AHT 2]